MPFSIFKASNAASSETYSQVRGHLWGPIILDNLVGIFGKGHYFAYRTSLFLKDSDKFVENDG